MQIVSRTIDYIDAMYCYLYGKYFDNICFVSIRENCLIFVRVFTHESSVRSTQRCKDSSFLITSELVVAPIISRFVSPDVFVFFCVLQKRKTSSGFISTKRLDFHEISWPCCIHQFEKILSIVAFTARDFSFILHRGWDIFIMYYFRYIYIYLLYVYNIFNLSWYWSVDRKNFNFHWSFSTLRWIYLESTYQSFVQMYVYVVHIGTSHCIVRYQTIKLSEITIGRSPISRLLKLHINLL